MLVKIKIKYSMELAVMEPNDENVQAGGHENTQQVSSDVTTKT